MQLPTSEAIRAEEIRRSLRTFIDEAWPIVEPGTEFKANWHIDAICEKLEAATRGEIRRLIINVPPRTMKSRIVSVMWPAWVWLSRPEARWLCASYSDDLATEMSVDCRTIVESEGGREQGGTLMERVGYRGVLALLGEDWELTDDSNLKTRFRNTTRGVRMATSVRAKITGFGGDFIVADDPHNALEAESDVERGKVLKWWDRAVASRMNDPKTGVRVVIMQRLHEVDLTGHLATRGGYDHLCLPMEYEPDHPHAWPDDPRSVKGELLWPSRFGQPEVDEYKIDPYTFAGQYQQRPAPEEGGILKRAWWQYYPPADDVPLEQTLQPQQLWTTWDTALKEKTTSDYTVGVVWARDQADRFVLRIARGQWGFNEALAQMLAIHDWLHGSWPHLTPTHYVEAAAMGPELIAAARRKIPGVIAMKASVDKVARANAVTPFLAGGNVWLPGYRMPDGGYDRTRTPASTQLLVEECAAFPNGAHDDQVDALVYGIDPRRWASGAKPRNTAERDERRRRARPHTSGLRDA